MAASVSVGVGALRMEARTGVTGRLARTSSCAWPALGVERRYLAPQPCRYTGGRGGIAADRASGSEGGVIERDDAARRPQRLRARRRAGSAVGRYLTR